MLRIWSKASHCSHFGIRKGPSRNVSVIALGMSTLAPDDKLIAQQGRPDCNVLPGNLLLRRLAIQLVASRDYEGLADKAAKLQRNFSLSSCWTSGLDKPVAPSHATRFCRQDSGHPSRSSSSAIHCRGLRRCASS